MFNKNNENKIAFVPIMVPETDYTVLHNCLKKENISFLKKNNFQSETKKYEIDRKKIIEVLYENTNDYFFIINNDREYSKRTACMPPKVFFVKKDFLGIPKYDAKSKTLNKHDTQRLRALELPSIYQPKVSISQALAAYCFNNIFHDDSVKATMLFVFVKKEPKTNKIFSLEFSDGLQTYNNYEKYYVMAPTEVSKAYLKSIDMTEEEYREIFEYQNKSDYKNEIKEIMKKKFVITNEECDLDKIFEEVIFSFTTGDFLKAVESLYNIHFDENKLYSFLRKSYVNNYQFKKDAVCLAETVFNIVAYARRGYMIIPKKLLDSRILTKAHLLYTNGGSKLTEKTGLFTLLQYYTLIDMILLTAVPIEYILQSTDFSESDIYREISKYDFFVDRISENNKKNDDSIEAKNDGLEIQKYMPMCDMDFFSNSFDIMKDKIKESQVKNDRDILARLIAEIQVVLDFLTSREDYWWLKTNYNVSFDKLNPVTFTLLISSLEAYIEKAFCGSLLSSNALKIGFHGRIDAIKETLSNPCMLINQYKKVFEDLISEKATEDLEKEVYSLFSSSSTIDYYNNRKETDKKNKRKYLWDEYEKINQESSARR